MDEAKAHCYEIKQILLNFQNRAATEGIRGDAAWTYEIKRELMDKGVSKGFKTCASGLRDECDSEWLYDLIWHKEDGFGDEARMIDVPMILESEWNPHFKFIKYDFEKLLLGNAKLKIMLCQARESRKQFLIDYFNESIKKFRRNIVNEIYLIAICDTDTEEFDFHTIEN